MLGRIDRDTEQDDEEPGGRCRGWLRIGCRCLVAAACGRMHGLLLVLVLLELKCCWCFCCRLFPSCPLFFWFLIPVSDAVSLVMVIPRCCVPFLNLCRIFHSCCNRSFTSACADFPLPFLGAGWLLLSGSSVSSSRSASGRSSGSGLGTGTPAASSTASIKSGSA